MYCLRLKSRERKQSKAFLLEGKRELSLVIKGGYKIKTLLFYPDLFSEVEAKAMSRYGIEIIEISDEVFQKIALRVVYLQLEYNKQKDRMKTIRKVIVFSLVHCLAFYVDDKYAFWLR